MGYMFILRQQTEDTRKAVRSDLCLRLYGLGV